MVDSETISLTIEFIGAILGGILASLNNEDAGIYSIIFSNSSNGSTIKVAGQVYSVVHNGTAYGLYYYDDLAKFELPEDTQTRERILKSIHFLN